MKKLITAVALAAAAIAAAPVAHAAPHDDVIARNVVGNPGHEGLLSLSEKACPAPLKAAGGGDYLASLQYRGEKEPTIGCWSRAGTSHVVIKWFNEHGPTTSESFRKSDFVPTGKGSMAF